MLRFCMIALTIFSLAAWLLVSNLLVPAKFEAVRWSFMQILLAAFGLSIVIVCVTYKKLPCTISTLGLFISIACLATGLVFGGRYGYLYFPQHHMQDVFGRDWIHQFSDPTEINHE